MLAIVSPWNKKLGYSNNDNLKFLESQYVVHATFPAIYEPQTWSFNDFINYYKWLTNSENKKNNEDANLMQIAFIRYTFTYNDIFLGYIDRLSMSKIANFRQKFKSKKTNKTNKKWLIKFKEARGRYPTKTEIKAKII